MAGYLQIPFSIRTKSTSDFQVSCSSDRIQWRNSAFHHNAWISSIHGHIAIADLIFNAETFFSISRSQFMKKKTHEMKLLNVFNCPLSSSNDVLFPYSQIGKLPQVRIIHFYYSYNHYYLIKTIKYIYATELQILIVHLPAAVTVDFNSDNQSPILRGLLEFSI